MKAVVLGFLIMSACTHASADSQQSAGLPALHTIQEVTLTRPYSCSGSYQTSALFLSDWAKNQGDPDLLYNGACGSSSYVQANNAGDDFALIADLGDVPLEKISAHLSFNRRNMAYLDESFRQNATLIEGHTYTVLEAKSDIRALFVFKVMKLQKDGPMTIRYAVKSYSLQATKAESPGFSWMKENQ